MNTKEAQLLNNKKMWTNLTNTLSSTFSLSFTCLLKVCKILIILSQNLITTIFIALKSSSYEESFLFAPSPMLESKQRTKYHINCEIGERLFHPMLAGEKICVQSHFIGFQERKAAKSGKVTSIASLVGALTFVFVITLTFLDFGILMAEVMV